MATGAKACKLCSKALRSDNKSGLCSKCYFKDPEIRQKYAEKDRDWLKRDRTANPEKYRQRWKAYDEANRDREKAKEKAWRQANPDKINAHDARHRSIKRDLFVETVYRSVVWKRDQGVCHLCLQPADSSDWHLDHVISLDDGGPHCYMNVAVAHPSCNTSKGRSSRSSCGVRWSEATGAYKQFHGRKYAP